MAFGTLKTDLWSATFTSALFWIGGSGTNQWNDINNWSDSSGGSTPASQLPDATTDVVFDSNSATNCQMDASGTCFNLNMVGYAYIISTTVTNGLSIAGIINSIQDNKIDGAGKIIFLNDIDLTGVTLNQNVENIIFNGITTTGDIGGNATSGTTINFNDIATWDGDDLTGHLHVVFSTTSTVSTGATLGLTGVGSSVVCQAMTLEGLITLNSGGMTCNDDVSSFGDIDSADNSSFLAMNGNSMGINSVAAGSINDANPMYSAFYTNLINVSTFSLAALQGPISAAATEVTGCTVDVSTPAPTSANFVSCVFTGGSPVQFTGECNGGNFNSFTGSVSFLVSDTNYNKLDGNSFNGGTPSVKFDISPGNTPLAAQKLLMTNSVFITPSLLSIQGTIQNKLYVTGNFTFEGLTANVDVAYCVVDNSAVTLGIAPNNEWPKAVGDGFNPDGGSNTNWLFSILSTGVYNRPYNRLFNRSFN